MTDYGAPPAAAPADRAAERSLLLLVALDAAGVGLTLAVLAQAFDPDTLLHGVWIVLAIEAFVFGLRTATVRIAAASVFVMAYAIAAQSAGPLGDGLVDLDLEEWPLMVVIAVIVAIMADRVTATGRRYAALYRAASDRLLTAQEDERKRLALDLHDGVGQTITALTLTLDAADAALAADGVAGAGRDGVRRARQIADTALEEARGVAHRLRPPRLTESGLIAAIRELAGSAGVQIAFHADPTLIRPGLLTPAAEVEAYRVVQEALGNATRHARAGLVTVSVARVDRNLRIEVTDDGVGFDSGPVHGRGLGLASMRDRAAAARGTLVVRSRPGVGTVVRLDVQLDPEAIAAIAADRADAAASVVPVAQ